MLAVSAAIIAGGPSAVHASSAEEGNATTTITLNDGTVIESNAVAKVIGAENAKLAYQLLRPEEKREFDRFMLPAESFGTSVTEPAVDQAVPQPASDAAPADDVTRSLAGVSALAAKAKKGCWTTKARLGNKAKGGNTLFTYWVVLKWCADGKKITKASIVEADGETSTPGWRYDGVKNKGARVVNTVWARGFAKHKFILGLAGWDVQNVDACVRTFGMNDGSQGVPDKVCSLYD
ncbi:hypothetical protein ACTOB_000517 [Actinoplanes oblitus]|uniref:Uncharacterized protein n=1 Tax=Actinoplanes oblitus TaxID=3040509 RepID=A0ABY8WHQ4_9ACTN|nr:hypothetical protein [Actinoplanes oblitus]WIM97027.1 hypothetical protein ACTOB_000517 [Actinoplanes oblitus]